ncbi:EAL domain-containing protein [Ruminococcus sp.]|uniref:EAL domain-containing protein n=1 Tax=Ruminococcus sp. TaxID=41978 RepID=UPI0025CCA380|nr:EAL domain-containing protein [Ruminococcus sp.]
MLHIDEQFIVDNFDDALANGAIRAYYQPVIRTLTEKICSVEALARWQDPVMGLLSPFLFINVLEKYRLIHKLDLYILENICVTYNEMREKGLPLHPFSINLSRLDFDEIDMLKAISEILRKYNVPSKAIHIEITESVMLDNTAYFRRIFDSFHDAGFAIFMDDFGSGYSSLNVLKDYSFDVLKIDMRFLSDIGSRSKKILASVVNMAKAIGIHTLAEGVETKEQKSFLRNIGCEMLQGYYYAKPMDGSLYVEYLAETGFKVEDPDEHHYWNDVGQINFLSPDPLNENDFVEAENGDYGFIRENAAPIALIEQTGHHVEMLYRNQAYETNLQKLGFSSSSEMVNAINETEAAYYPHMDDQIQSSIKTGNVVKEDHFLNGIYFTYFTKCIAQTDKKVMLAASIQTYGSDVDMSTNEMFDTYSRALIDTFDHITIMDPEKNRVIARVYSKQGYSTDYSNMPLIESINRFAAEEVVEEERLAFLDFIDPPTLRDRMAKAGRRFLQKTFRVKCADGSFKPKDLRITKLYLDLNIKGTRELFMLTMQSVIDGSN